MKFCPIVSEIFRGHVHVARKERIIIIIKIIIIIIIIIYNYSLLLRSIRVFMDLQNDIHRNL
jgi:hypothetical protein